MTTAKSLLYEYLKDNVFDDHKLRTYREDFLDKLKDKEPIQDIFDEADNDKIKERIKDLLKNNFKEKIDFDNLIKLAKQFKKQTKITFRYYQTFAILFSYVLLSLKNDKSLIESYILYMKEKHWLNLSIDAIKTEINRLNYWMATWSWKTYLMYFMLLMYLTFDKEKDKIFILVPSDSLRTQHKNFIENNLWEWKVWEEFSFNFSSLKNEDETLFSWNLSFNKKDYSIILTSTQKLFHKDKIQEIENIEKALFIFDEGHKWEAWITDKEDNKKINLIRKWNFVFDWSATFKQIYQKEVEQLSTHKTWFKDDKIKLFDYYAPTSIFRYDMTIFKSDWFWKYPKTIFIKWDNDDLAIKLNVISSLIWFAKQIQTWNKEIQIEENQVRWKKDWATFYKPLYLWVAHTKNSNKKNDKWELDKKANDNLKWILKQIISLYQDYLNKWEKLFDEIKQEFEKLDINYEFKDEIKNIENLFKNKEEKIVFELINDNEILFNVWWYKWLINIWWAKKFLGDAIKNDIQKQFSDLVNTTESKLNKNESFFSKLEEKQWSDIVYLFWSKKFIEWWDNKRPSTLMIVKWADGSDTTAIQLLWRWLRLEGINWDWFRHISEKNENEKTFELEKLYIAWYGTKELEKFLEQATWEIKVVKVHKTEYYDKEEHKEKITSLLNNDKLFYPKFNKKEETKKWWKYTITTEWDEWQNFKIKVNDKFIKFNTEIKYNILNIKQDSKTTDTNSDNEVSKPDFEIVKWNIYKVLNDFIISNNTILEISENEIKNIYNNLKIKWIDNKEDILWKIKIIEKYFENLFKKVLETETTYNIENYILKEKDIIFEYNIELTFDNWEELEELIGFDLKPEYKNEDYFVIDEKWVERYFEIEDVEMIEKEIKKINDEITYLISQWKNFLDEEVKNKNKKLVELQNKKEKLEKNKNNKLKEILEKLINNLVKDNLVKDNNEKKHLYKRLYNIDDVKKELENKSKYWIIADKKDNIHFTPTSIFELNNYEKDRLPKFIKKIENKFSCDYEIYFYRNIPKKWSNLLYINNDWLISNFYPDFIFWLLPKDEDDKSIIIFYEPKWNEEEWRNKASALKYLNNKLEDDKLKDDKLKNLVKLYKQEDNEVKDLEEELVKYYERLDDNVIFVGVMDKDK